MSPSNTTSAPEATTEAYVHGILDKEDTDVTGKRRLCYDSWIL